jgi:hypothetical protein
MYGASDSFEVFDFALATLFESPTTETAPFAPERFSLVQTFFGFFVSAGVAAACDGAVGAGAPLC